MKILKIIKPDDMHCHLRQGEMLKSVVDFSNVFGKVVVMGNLVKPIIRAININRYRKEILSHNPKFKPIMAVMLTKQTTPKILQDAYSANAKLLKLIPGGTSTNSSDGVRFESIKEYYPVIKIAEKLKIILSIHAELDIDSNGKNIKEVEREKAAIPYLKQIIKDFPKLKIIIEHASTKAILDFVKKAPKNVGATLTVHHSFINYSDVFNNNGNIINAFNYCKPIAKSEKDRQAVVSAMTSGNPKFFFGSDSAPHSIDKKQASPPAAGIFSAPLAIPLLCQIFSENNKLDKLENFTSCFGADFYGLPRNKEKIEILEKEWIVPNKYKNIVPFLAGQKIKFQIKKF